MGQLKGIDEQAFADTLPTGTVLREFVIESVIGQGGFGIVYRVRHRHLRRVVALKEYFPRELAVRREGTVRLGNQSESADYEEGLRRFMEEARRLEQLRGHPGIVTCLGFFEEQGTAYLAMEYEDGMSLSELLASREAAANPIGEGELLQFAEQLLESLSAVHEAEVLHRDIKPSNILVRRSDERPVLIDFGAAKMEFTQHTKSYALRRPGYAAIEQVEEDGELGPWTDSYGLGAVLWRKVAGGIGHNSGWRRWRHPAGSRRDFEGMMTHRQRCASWEQVVSRLGCWMRSTSVWNLTPRIALQTPRSCWRSCMWRPGKI